MMFIRFNTRSLSFTAGLILGSIIFCMNLPAEGQVIPTTVTAPPAETPVAPPAAYPSTMTVNYIRAWTPSMPTTDSNAVISTGNTTAQVKQTTQYYDGLGRLIQTVTKAITPAGRDLVAPVVYDEFGRQVYQYLPYPQTTANASDGKFKLDPFNGQSTAIQSLNLYPGEQIYYGQTNYEASPLNRVLKTMAPGNSWAGSSRGVSESYEVNTASDSVRIWTIAEAAGSLPVSTAAYNAGELYKQVTTDEAGNRVVVFKDKEGHLILKKTALSAGASDGHAGWLCTYYVYDDLNNLRFVIPPKAVDYLLGYNWTMAQAVADELCFRYEYDGKKRMIVKKIPGAGEVFMIYDNRDRLVYSQDSTERTGHEWLVTYYDAQNRPVETGLYTDASATMQSLQTGLDTIGASGGSGEVPAPNDLVVTTRTGNTPAVYVARNSITFMPGFAAPAGDQFTTDIDPNAMVESSGEDNANPVPPINPDEVTPLTYTYYDDYSWSGHLAFQSSYLSKTTDGGNPYAEAPTTYSYKTRGLVTGALVRVIESNPVKWLTTTTYYDDKGRVLQTLSSNLTGGTDIVTNEYDFSGKVLSSYLVNENNQSTVTPQTNVLTEYNYDAAGRLLTVTKTLNDQSSTRRTIATNTYNELGQLQTKTLGNNLETLNYHYNIRGWLTGINPQYAEGTATHYFGEELGYDYGFSQDQYNGNIAGEKWRSKDDGEQRAYGFSYDSASRLTRADFTQYNGGWNTSAGVDFSVSNLTYDPNGNIQSMRQMGLKVNNSAPIDELKYAYNTNSNQLFSITDTIPPPPGGAGGGLGDFHDGTNGAGTADYSYDGNGNLTEDLNKAISSINYNYLNLPETIVVTGKGTVQFVYDAKGDKLQKIVTDNTVSPAKTTTTDYIDGFEYHNDTLQFFPTEEGRVRYIPADSTIPASYVYDYFIKDHLGNIRMVLTEQAKEDMYAATMESQNAQTENQLFDNISLTAVLKPTGFDNDPNNKQVSQLDGSAGNNTLPRVGPSIVLKVMAGDTITIGTYAWYPGTVEPPPSGASNLLNDLLNALTGGVISNSHGIYNGTDNNPNTILSGDLGQFFTNDENTNYTTAAPKAFLNWVAFDNQLNEVPANSGVVQVPTISGSEQAQPLVAPEQIIQKDGYLYIYVSNESAQKVFFDNLVIHHNRGPILQTDSYYPFGLTMAGISDQAALSVENNYKFNGIELNHKEFSDGSGLELYTAHFRGLDPQIGRWWQIDPKPTYDISPYAAMGDDPILHGDFWGDTIINNNGRPVSYKVNKDNSLTWSKGTSNDIQTIGNDMIKTKIGREMLAKMASAKYPIKIVLNKKDILYIGKNNSLKSTYIKGDRVALGFTSPPKNSNLKNGITVTIYKAAITKYTDVSGQMKIVAGHKIQYSKYSIDENIGADATHEATHATNKGSMSWDNPRELEEQIEKKPQGNELLYYKQISIK